MIKPSLSFDQKEQKDFTVTLKKRVDSYFKDNNISRHANALMVFKTIVYLSMLVTSYSLLMSGTLSVGWSFVVWGVLGFSIAMSAVNIGHDAIHGAYSGKKWVNELLSHSFNINGASAYMWKKMHNIAHHTYTNIDGYDDDLVSIPIIRLTKAVKWMPIHRFQHFYVYFFYGLASFTWVFIKDYAKFFKNEVGNYTGKAHPTSAYFWLFFWKFLNYTIYLIIPMLVLPYFWWQILLGYFIMHYVAGLILATTFMLAHAVEEAIFPDADENNKIQRNWAVHQLETTVNFARNSTLAQWLTGGLNQQVEHHLFPKICSIHYPALGNIVKQTAEEYNVPYLESSFPDAWMSHMKLVYRMGHEK